MRVHAWLVPGTWQAVVDACLARPHDDQITLLVAADPVEDIPSGIMGSLMGRGHRTKEFPHTEQLSLQAADDLMAQAVSALGRPAEYRVLQGRTERVVTDACADADVLLLARDGDRSRLGPRSLGDHTRFVLDHAPCTVTLLWPGDAPSLASIPPAPPR